MIFKCIAFRQLSIEKNDISCYNYQKVINFQGENVWKKSGGMKQ